jgi:predicted nucleic acid-binding protein
MFLLDTSILTRLRAPSVLKRIEELDAAGLARTSMTDLEIGFSARNAEEWDRLVVALGAFRRIDVEAHHFDRALQGSTPTCCRWAQGTQGPRSPRCRSRRSDLAHGPALRR